MSEAVWIWPSVEGPPALSALSSAGLKRVRTLDGLRKAMVYSGLEVAKGPPVLTQLAPEQLKEL